MAWMAGPCWSKGPEGLPVVVDLSRCANSGPGVVDEIVGGLAAGLGAYAGLEPRAEEASAWRGFVGALLDELAGADYTVLLEYPVLGGLGRADALIVGRGSALVVEAKGWRSLKVVDDVRVEADGVVAVNPCYQLESYLAKMRLLHKAGARLKLEGAVYAYNAPAPWGLGCRVAARGGLAGLAESLLRGPPEGWEVDVLLRGGLELRGSLVEALRDALRGGLHGSLARLLSSGHGLAGPQADLVVEVMEALESGERRVFLVEGASGSGKTLVALTLFLYALSRGYKALLGYVNNRLVNVLRHAVSEALGDAGRAVAGLIGFSAVGPPRYLGFCERRHDYAKYGGGVDLLVLDEAQRLPQWAVESCFRAPARVIVAFYDDSQVLLARERGTGARLEAAASASGRPVARRSLPSPVRVPRAHLEAVRGLLWGDSGPEATPLEVRVFEDVREMLDALRSGWRAGRRIALVCAFTESEGDRERKLSWDSIRNIRIGYPLQSGFDRYKGLGLRVKWLMDEKLEYPLYWSQRFDELARLYGFERLDPVSVCSSVYGAQGMEAEVVGVVWGRDLVWRDGWTVQPGPITDTIGGRASLKRLAVERPREALELLKNRYYVMLTRATRALYLYFEDDETGRYVREALRAG